MAFKQISLTKGFVTIVDSDDYDFLMQWKWHCTSAGYPARGNYIEVNGDKKHKIILMHRVIMDTPDGMDTDHINGNKLDNRRHNLRICTTSENLRNRISRHGANKNKGIGWHKAANKWEAYICYNGKKYHLGLFVTEQEAALAYNEAAKKHFGEFARLNII